MSEKLTIHRALAELKTLDEVQKQLVGNFNRVNELIKRRDTIKRALIKKNAETVVKVGSQEMTIAEAIEKKNSIGYEENFLQTLKKQFNQANAKVTKENDELPTKLETYLQGILGDKASRKVEEVESHTEAFNRRNTWDLIDPNHLATKVLKEMEDNLYEFKTEVDAVLSEVNASTFIEI